MEMVLTEGLMVTILGFLTVFVILIFISIILAVFGKIANSQSQNKTEKIEKVPPKTVITSETLKTEEKKSDDLELIAVITAAIVASERAAGNKNISPDKLVVRSLRRVNGWNKETLHEQHSTLY